MTDTDTVQIWYEHVLDHGTPHARSLYGGITDSDNFSRRQAAHLKGSDAKPYFRTGRVVIAPTYFKYGTTRREAKQYESQWIDDQVRAWQANPGTAGCLWNVAEKPVLVYRAQQTERDDILDIPVTAVSRYYQARYELSRFGGVQVWLCFLLAGVLIGCLMSWQLF